MTGREPDLELIVTCVNLNRDGSVCGKSGLLGLPSGVCVEHAVHVFRAVIALGGKLQGIPLDDITAPRASAPSPPSRPRARPGGARFAHGR